MIRGSKIQLRAIEEADLEFYYSWINDEETNQWRGLYHPTSLDEAKEWIAKQRKQGPTLLNLAIETSDRVLIGFVGLSGICPRSRRAEVWIYIGSKDHWGHGFGEDTVRTLCGYAFKEMNLHRIWLECNPEFENVVRCYEKVGFKTEGILRDAYYRAGKFRNTCIMGLLRDDFREGAG
jgi:RimJ/RimL family protein N-acetyltransferase